VDRQRFAQIDIADLRADDGRHGGDRKRGCNLFGSRLLASVHVVSGG
jgi:hypothetical protein